MMLDAKLIVTLVTSLIGGIPPTIMALAALRQGKTNGHKADAISGKADAITEKADSLTVKTGEIHVLANGNLARITAELHAAEERIKALENMVLALTAGRRQPPVLP